LLKIPTTQKIPEQGIRFMGEYEFLEIERHQHVTRVFLNRPQQANALNSKIMTELEQVSRSFLDDEETRVVIFAGRGKHFSAGADLKQGFSPAQDSMLMRRRKTGLGARMIRAITGINQVTIAAVQGAALGGGACIPVACDFRIGARGCFMGYPEVALGINLMWHSLPLCVHLIGTARAKKMIMSGKRESAETLYRWGMLDELVEESSLLEKAEEMAQEYANLPPLPVQMIKQSVNMVSGALDQAIMHMDTDQNMLTGTSQDRITALKAYFNEAEKNYTGN
jgi:enoyl-CoA hydratase/carnithine racemase